MLNLWRYPEFWFVIFPAIAIGAAIKELFKRKDDALEILLKLIFFLVEIALVFWIIQNAKAFKIKSISIYCALGGGVVLAVIFWWLFRMNSKAKGRNKTSPTPT